MNDYLLKEWKPYVIFFLTITISKTFLLYGYITKEIVSENFIKAINSTKPFSIIVLFVVLTFIYLLLKGINRKYKMIYLKLESLFKNEGFMLFNFVLILIGVSIFFSGFSNIFLLGGILLFTFIWGEILIKNLKNDYFTKAGVLVFICFSSILIAWYDLNIILVNKDPQFLDFINNL